jgi:predicted kinase
MFTDFIKWAKDKDWAQSMKDTSQSLPYHNEDVWEHSLLALKALDQFDFEDKEIVSMAAFLHDCAKPDTAELNEDGTWTFPKHSIHGEKKARRILIDYGMNFHDRERICKLVRYHMWPSNITDNNVEDMVVYLSHKLKVENLCYLHKADRLGRNVPYQTGGQVGASALKFESEYYDCYDKPFAFPSDSSRVMYYQKKTSPYYDPYFKDVWVTMMVGLPNSGKTTWVKDNMGGSPIVSLDEIRVRNKIKPSDKKKQGLVAQIATHECREFLRKEESFVFDATNVTEKVRNKWIDLFLAYNAKIRIVYIEVPMEIILHRNKGRKKPVPEDVLKKLFHKLEVPDLTECHEIIYEIGVER